MPINSFENFTLTWKPRLKGEEKAKYLELAAKLEDDILSKKLKPGTRLPPQRELADYLDIDFTTVTRAYQICREKGLIYGIVGRGTFVASEVETPKGAIYELGVVEAFPEVGAKRIVEATTRVLSRGDAARLFTYSERDGRARAKEAAIKWLKREGIAASEDELAIFPGTQSALSVILISLFQPGDKIAVDEFTYSNFIKLAQIAHLKLVPIKGDKDGMLANALDCAAEKEKLKGVYLMPTKANPTGITMSEKRREEIAETIKRRGLLVIEDGGAVFSGELKAKPFAALCPENTLHLSPAARFLASGLRIAFVVYPKQCAAKLLSGLHHLAIKASSLDAEILAELILSGDAEKILNEKARKMKEANKIFDNLFRAKGEGFFRTVPLANTSGKGEEIEERLRRKGIRVCHSDRFALRTNGTESFLRVSVSSIADLQNLTKALSALKENMI